MSCRQRSHLIHRHQIPTLEAETSFGSDPSPKVKDKGHLRIPSRRLDSFNVTQEFVLKAFGVIALKKFTARIVSFFVH